MNKREKIITGLALCAALYGAFEFIPLKREPGKSNVDKRPDLDKFVRQVSVKAAKAAPTDALMYKITKVHTAWERDPFMRVREPGDEETARTAGEEPFIYSGFIRSGNDFFAVINGMAYGKGEIIEDTGAALVSISPERVVITRPDKTRLEVFLKEIP